MRRTDRPEVGHARAVDRLVGGGQALVRRRVLAELHGGRTQVDRHALPATSTLRFVEDASRPGGSATASRSPAAGGSAASAQGLLGGSGGSDAAGAAAAELAARRALRRWREVPVASATRGWCCSLGWQSGEWRVADGSDGLAPAASCFAARCLYGAFVVAGAAPDRRQLPLSGGGLALSIGGTLNFLPPNSNSSPRSRGPTSMSASLIRRMSTRCFSAAYCGVGHDQPKPVAEGE